jgi:formiminoglutamase
MINSLCSGIPKLPHNPQDYQYGARLIFRPDFDQYADQIKIALVTEGEDLTPYAAFRQAFYKLAYNAPKHGFIDLGGYKGQEAGLTELLDLLHKKGIFTIVVGQSPHIPLALLEAHSHNTSAISMALADSCLDFGTEAAPSLLKKLLLKYPDYLGQLNFMGYQSYFVDKSALQFLQQQLFETYRLGKLQEQMHEAEPMLRNMSAFSFQLASIAAVHSPASHNPNPNGFKAQEACQIMRYAGMSDRMNSIALYGYAPEKDDAGLTAMLLAQMFWYAVEGFNQRTNEVPPVLEDLVRYELQLAVGHLPISFFKSNRTERWWFYVFEHGEQKAIEKLDIDRLYPCSYQDYLLTCEGDLPERIMMALERKV